MELGNFRARLITATFERNGEGVELTFNADAFTPEFFRGLARSLRERLMAAQQQATASVPPQPDKRGRKRKPAPVAPPALAADLFRSIDIKADVLEIQRDVYAELLAAHVLRAWSVTEGGEPVAPTYAVLRTLGLGAVKALFDFCVEQASPKAQPAPTS